MALPAAIALSGLNKECFPDELDDLLHHGAKLLKSPNVSSVNSIKSQKSGLLSNDSSAVKDLFTYFELLFSLPVELQSSEGKIKPDVNLAVFEIPEEPPSVPAIEDIKIQNKDTLPNQDAIMYQNRNILDLFSNIEWKPVVQPAIEIMNSHKDFNSEDQSQSIEACLPGHRVYTCPHKLCNFMKIANAD